ncbi:MULTISPECIES: hypothetical protein [Buttiauxella]|jgi:subtilisin-like proprotein convertase family protein|uniref:Uncharacterized protein n=1 Tax=Buttiauxella ferragutiae ATCC 51602 TaxID=1354252 RepID=A0ABX2WDJ6_9ENTR|nr:MULTISPECIES: hypothetical protein [Buttiauxella]AYN27799.1 hypothetical protein D8682_12915 [Buttiauxella sp. 3AFRM03]MCE0828280.1 hypothetical protein [Buttiauxella ferragutiae]OAT33114.1 hypothetical protein M976_00392 [Buttiauxella ferragutiae ATCC 51602]TDN50135.1 hypothetical protein EC843_10652 [Buttiauxella sp. JUb87]UNK60929.1 hypothetical protein MNO13_21720 [Buttiauxella ferragutiae]
MKPIQTIIKSAATVSLLAFSVFSANAQILPVAGDFQADHFSAKVVSVDQKNHVVVLEGEKGNKVSFNVPEETGTLANLKAGDVVDTTVTRSVAVAFDTNVDKAAPTASSTKGMEKATEASPEHEAFRQVNVQLKIKHIDLKNNTVTFVGPKGQEKVITVEDPEVQARLKEMKVNQSVRVTYTDSIKITAQQAK